VVARGVIALLVFAAILALAEAWTEGRVQKFLPSRLRMAAATLAAAAAADSSPRRKPWCCGPGVIKPRQGRQGRKNRWPHNDAKSGAGRRNHGVSRRTDCVIATPFAPCRGYREMVGTVPTASFQVLHLSAAETCRKPVLGKEFDFCTS
jgi:hypothetical protein